MDITTSLILSAVEGLTEFLPVSSTGHLVLVSRLLGVGQSEFVKSFEVIIQLGAILAVVILYRMKFLTQLQTMVRVVISFIPTAVVGFVLYPLIKSILLGNELITLVALAVGGFIFIILEKILKNKKPQITDTSSLPYSRAVVIGLLQSVSMIPGVSRAAATIFGALLVGMERKSAVEFSFLLAVPTMLAATVLDLLKTNHTFSSNELILLATGFIGSFIFALIAVKFLLSFIKTHSFIPFGIYRIVLAIAYYFLVLSK